jgi:hypothetical protein
MLVGSRTAYVHTVETIYLFDFDRNYVLSCHDNLKERWMVNGFEIDIVLRQTRLKQTSERCHSRHNYKQTSSLCLDRRFQNSICVLGRKSTIKCRRCGLTTPCPLCVAMLCWRRMTRFSPRPRDPRVYCRFGGAHFRTEAVGVSHTKTVKHHRT